jgi:MoaA/NifB/PqqE/SkfB family radical SAM enzyme
MKYSFDFALTTYCQARCRSCMRTNEKTGEKADWLTPTHMKFDVFKRVIDTSNIMKNDTTFIQFCGELGDPMMHPKIEQFIEYGLNYVDYIHINTNGGLRNPDWYAYMAKKFPKRIRIKFGVDGTDHDTNWLYREGVDFNRAVDNMQSWFDNDGLGSWHFLIFEWNWHQIPEAKELAEKLGTEVEFKFNNRSWGKISDENKKHAYDLLESIGEY